MLICIATQQTLDACWIFAQRNSLTLMWDHDKKPSDFTYTAANMTLGGSRIDHFLFSHELADSTIDFHILDATQEQGHRPVLASFDLSLIPTPAQASSSVDPIRNIAWHKVENKHTVSPMKNGMSFKC